MKKFVKKMVSKLYVIIFLQFEKTFITDKCQLKYLFFKKNKSKRLLVIFSSCSREGLPARYNYLLKFRNLFCSKLYILDNFGFDKRGAYYLGEDKNFYIESAVHRLIERKRKELDIEKDKVVLVGSSKGGFAAIYFQNKYSYGASISGAPQVYLGNYLNTNLHKHICTFIMGDTKQSSINFLNNLIFDAVKNNKGQSKVGIHVSKKEHTYLNHVAPLVEFFKENNLDIVLDFGDYHKHSDVGIHFSKFATKTIPIFFEELENKSRK
ncbi:TPA: accessory Sec system protein Asp2 [Enterococcus faecalis]